MDTLKEYYQKALGFKPQYPIDQETADFICDFINKNAIQKMLEIGSGVGYSANYFALNTAIYQIDTYEKRYGFYLFAKTNQLSKKINFFWEDFLYGKVKENKYPLIFIDAAKLRQKEIFEKAVNFLDNNGTIIVDNMNCNRLKTKNLNTTKTNKAHEKILLKNEEFKIFLSQLEGFEIFILDIGDGVAICYKKTKQI